MKLMKNCIFMIPKAYETFSVGTELRALPMERVVKLEHVDGTRVIFVRRLTSTIFIVYIVKTDENAQYVIMASVQIYDDVRTIDDVIRKLNF